MQNGIMLNALFEEYYQECRERTMLISDFEAIKRVRELLTYELPEVDKFSNGKE